MITYTRSGKGWMTKTAFARFLKEHKACPEASAWCKGKTEQEAWETCTNETWMLWLVFEKFSGTSAMPRFFRLDHDKHCLYCQLSSLRDADAIRKALSFTFTRPKGR